MNLFRIFQKDYVRPPLSVSVREALKVCIEGMEPKVTPEEFESLYKEVLESEIHDRKEAASIIDKFKKQRTHGKEKMGKTGTAL